MANSAMLRVRSQRTRLTAQPQGVEILQRHRHDHQVVIAFRRAEQRLGRVGLDIDIVLGRERGGHAIIGRLAIVNEQNASALAFVGDGIPLRALHADFEGGLRAHAQLVGHHLQPRQRAHARNQHDVGNRLGEKIVGAGLKPAHPVGRIVERRDHHHRNEMRRRI